MDTEQTKRHVRTELDYIFHPTDLSAASEVAFCHALKLTLVSQARLTLMHVAPQVRGVDMASFPAVRQTLERWGALPPGSEREDIDKLNIYIDKEVEPGSDPVDTALQYLHHNSTDMIVLAVHQHEGKMGWLRRSVGTPLARKSEEMTLYVPHGQDGFVSRETGAISLKNIVVPIDRDPPAIMAVSAAYCLATVLDQADTTFTLLYVGSEGDRPQVALPPGLQGTWRERTVTGKPVEQILAAANELDADAIVMTTAGRKGFLEALGGSTTEKVLAGAPCPVLTIPSILGPGSDPFGLGKVQAG